MCWRATHTAPQGSHLCCFSYHHANEAFQYSNVCKNLPGFRGSGVLAARWQSANCVMVCLYGMSWLLRLKREGRRRIANAIFRFADDLNIANRVTLTNSLLTYTFAYGKKNKIPLCKQRQVVARQVNFPPAPHYFWPYYMLQSNIQILEEGKSLQHKEVIWPKKKCSQDIINKTCLESGSGSRWLEWTI